MTRKLLFTYAAPMLAALALAGTAQGQSADLERTYKGKRITVLIGYSMGGTYGQYSTLLSEHLPRHIPGHPNMIVQSMPGAGGLKATNYAAKVAPKDGSYILMPPDSIVINQLLRPEAARYKSDDFTWLGNAAESNSVIAVTKRSGVRFWADALNRKVAVSSTGKGSQTFIVPQMLNGVFGAKFDPIMGYKGSAGSMHAMELGETEGVSLTWVTLKKNRPRWWDDSDHATKAIAIIQVGFRKEPDLMNVPLARDLAKSKADRQIIDFVATLGPIGRGLATVPGTPENLTQGLRAAFQKMIDDPAFAADGKKRKLAIQPKTGKEVQAIVEEVMTMPADVVERARKAILGGTS